MKRIYESITPQYQMDTPTRSKYDRKTAQSGRSMVETIGVLAVIGVLTIGGIAGYNYGINKHRANQILQDIRLIYQETKYPNTVRQILETEEFPDMELDTQSPYDYSFDFPDLNDFIYDSAGETVPNLISVNVSGVPQTACDILLKTKPEYVLILKANGQAVWTCDKSENELNYIFAITADSLDYGTCSVCTSEHCFDDDLNCPEGEYCYNDTCSRCAHGYTENKSGQCVQCSASWNGINTVDEENCLRCGDNAYSKHHKKCYSCDKMSNWETTLDECNECSHNPNVVAMKTTTTGHVGCFNCKNFGYYPSAEKAQCEKCMAINDNIIFYPKDANGTATTGLCTKCDTKNADGTACECPTGQFWIFSDGNHSFCRSCTEAPNTYSSKVECDKCSERYFLGTNERNGRCILCSGVSNWEMTKEECDKCTAKNESTIPMKTTTTGGVGCFDCKTFGYYPSAEKAQCEKCMKYDENIIFYPKDANGTATTGLCTKCNTKNTEGTACECPAGNFWIFSDGNHSFCRSCTDTANNNVYASKIECDKCPNRYYNVAKGGNDRNGRCPICPTGQVKDTSAEGDGRRCVAQ
ncbi:MAG: type II secretion system protein [Alphaproteobacteria bacterium]|nr:type II secretion system protein [Alphaproteobacteria bacterium]